MITEKSSRLCGVVCAALLSGTSGCSMTREVWPAPRVVEASPPVVDSVELSAAGAWSAQLPDASSEFSLHVEQRRSCTVTTTKEEGGDRVVRYEADKSNQRWAYGIGGLGVLFTGIGALSKDEEAKDTLYVGALMSLALIPAIWSTLRDGREEVRQLPSKRVSSVSSRPCPPDLDPQTAHHVELILQGHRHAFDTDASGRARFTMPALLQAFDVDVSQANRLDASSRDIILVDGQQLSGPSSMLDQLREGLNGYMAREVDRGIREDETRTGRCHPEHAREFEEIANDLSRRAGDRLRPEAKVTIVSTPAGTQTRVNVAEGGTYHVMVTGRGVRGVQWRDAHGDRITQGSPLFRSPGPEWFMDTRQFVAGPGDPFTTVLTGEGCAVLLVAQAPAGEPRRVEEAAALPPELEIDASGRRVIRGPISPAQNLVRVHIVSDSIGVVHDGPLPLTIEDSIISAPICVRTPGDIGLSLFNNDLDCDLGVEFTGHLLLGNAFMDNRVRGVLQNRPM
jgi:hypothetical protein